MIRHKGLSYHFPSIDYDDLLGVLSVGLRSHATHSPAHEVKTSAFSVRGDRRHVVHARCDVLCRQDDMRGVARVDGEDIDVARGQCLSGAEFHVAAVGCVEVDIKDIACGRDFGVGERSELVIATISK